MSDNTILTMSDYKVLTNIIDKSNVIQGSNKLKATTVQMLMDRTQLSYSTIRLSIIKLKKLNLIADGVKNGKIKTYYITEQGLLEIESVKKVVKLVNLGGNNNE